MQCYQNVQDKLKQFSEAQAQNSSLGAGFGVRETQGPPRPAVWTWLLMEPSVHLAVPVPFKLQNVNSLKKS